MTRPEIPATIEVRWSSQREQPEAFVLMLYLVDRARTLVEAWRETGHASRKIVVPRRSASCTVTEDGDLLHIDLRLEGRRAIAMTMPREGEGPCYVHCDFLTHGGAYDPPTLKRLAAEPEAATA